MAKINVVLSDTDELYLNKLSGYFKEKAEAFNVNSFTSQDILEKFLLTKTEMIDVLIIPEKFINDIIKQINIPAKIIFSDTTNTVHEGFEVINKYQKAEKLISDIMLIFSRKTGRQLKIKKGSRNAKIVGIYSPVGGSGKTTISLALSTLCASMGLKVFYLNFEAISSSEVFFEKAPIGSITDVFLSLKTKGSNVGLKIIANKYTDPATKISYFNSAESAMEYDEITEEEIMKLLNEFESIGEYDIIFIDMQSTFSKYNLNIMKSCDRILIPFEQNPISISKINRLLNEFKLHESLAVVNSKINLIANKVDANGAATINSSDIVRFRSIDAFIPYSPVFTDVKYLAYAGNLSQTALMNIVNIIRY